MMKKFLVVSLLGAVLLACSMSSAVLAADNFKVGVVDLFKVLNESDTGKRAKADLESLIKSRQLAMDEKGKNIEKLKADFEKQASLLSPEAKKAKEEELERLVRDYQRMGTDSQAELKKKESELTAGILTDLREHIAQIGQEEGYTLILENAGGVVLYFDKPLDLTDKIIKRYNEAKSNPAKK